MEKRFKERTSQGSRLKTPLLPIAPFRVAISQKVYCGMQSFVSAHLQNAILAL